MADVQNGEKIHHWNTGETNQKQANCDHKIETNNGIPAGPDYDPINNRRFQRDHEKN